MQKEKPSVSNSQEDWLTDELYKSWARKMPEKPQKVLCILWTRTFDIGSSGVAALNSH